MSRVLLAVDGSDASVRAAEKLARVIDHWKARPELHVLTVHVNTPFADRATGLIGADAVKRYYDEESAEALAPARAKLDAAGVRYTVHTAVGEVSEKIVGTAKSLGCELIAMGTHGRGKVGTMVLGSVAQKVLHVSPIPLLLVP
jgi:nucleotide-binding universal stress UspA family protein